MQALCSLFTGMLTTPGQTGEKTCRTMVQSQQVEAAVISGPENSMVRAETFDGLVEMGGGEQRGIRTERDGCGGGR